MTQGRYIGPSNKESPSEPIDWESDCFSRRYVGFAMTDGDAK